jgi:SAM-dependent methyltransferase
MNAQVRPAERRELLIGCGNDKKKKITFSQSPDDWHNLTTLDIDPGCKPDVVWDLNVLPLPFDDNTFDEIHASEVLEHVGRQGDWKFFFDEFYDFWRILKPGGFLVATVPSWDSPWAFGDPGHTRVICRESLIFLDQTLYEQVGRTAMTDYRPWWKGDFETMGAMTKDEHQFAFVLRARK